MSLIFVNLDRVRLLGEDSKHFLVRYTNAKNGILSTGAGIDYQIKARRNIGTRVSRVCQSLDLLEMNLKKLDTFLYQAVEQYSNIEDNLVRKAQSIGEVENKKSLWREILDRYSYELDYNWLQLPGRGAGFDFLNAYMDSNKLMKYAKDLNFKMYRDNEKVYIRVIDGLISNLEDFTKYRNLLSNTLEGTARWERDFVTRLVNSGVPLYNGKFGNGSYLNRNSNIFRNTPFNNLSTYIDHLGMRKRDIFKQSFKNSAIEGAKLWKDFTGWKGASTMTKVGKLSGAFGSLFTVVDNSVDSFYNRDTGKWEPISGQNLQEFVVGTTVDVSTAVAAMAAGAAVGSLILPPAGTVVGALAGGAANLAINVKFIGDDPPKSLVDFTKDGINGAIDGIEKGVNKSIDYIEDIAGDVSNKAKAVAHRAEEKAGEIIDGLGKQMSKIFW